MRYRVLEADTSYGLAVLVQDYCEMGWDLQGGVCKDAKAYMQAMVYSDDEPFSEAL